MSENRLEKIPLENHLILEIWDLSRTLAGDRWLVCIEARMDIPLEMKHLEGEPEKEKRFSVMKKRYGAQVPYRYKEKKHFVEQGEKDELIDQFTEIIKKNLVPYLSHPDFAKKFILSRLAELRTKRPELFLSD